MRNRMMGLIAALMLVALGIALGAGPLQGDADRIAQESARQRAALEQRDTEIAGLRQSAELSAALTSSTMTRMVSGRLTNRKVALVTLPGANPETVQLLDDTIRAGGGAVSGRVSVTEALLDPASKGLVDALSSQMIEQNDGVTAGADADGYQRIGALLARAVGVAPAVKAASAPYDPTAIGILSGLKAAKLVDVVDVAVRAALTVVVLPEEGQSAQSAALVAVLEGYGAQVPTVVAGPTQAAGEDGVLAALRGADDALSTVDSVETQAGQVVTVLALSALVRGEKGDFGAVGPLERAVPPDS